MCKERKIDIRPYLLVMLVATGVFRSEIHSWFDVVWENTNDNNSEHPFWGKTVADKEGLDMPAPLLFQKIHVNTADRELLQTIKGVGPSLADAIVISREKSGPFHSGEDLEKIKGVGEKKAVYLSKQLLFD